MYKACLNRSFGQAIQKRQVYNCCEWMEPLITSLLRSGLAYGRCGVATGKVACLPVYPPKYYEGSQAGKHVVVSGCSKQHCFIIKTLKHEKV